MTTVPDITRLIARVADWQEGHGKPGGRADAARRLEEAHKLLEEDGPAQGQRGGGVSRVLGQ